MNTKREPATTDGAQDRDREPARKAGALASSIVALLLLYRVLTAEEALAWGNVLESVFQIAAPYLTAEMIRRKVIPVETVKAAGLDPAEINRAADDPAVPPFVEP